MVLVMASNGMPHGLPPTGPPTNPNSVWENGREYHSYHKGVYMYPCDEIEKDRMDIFHKFFQVARKDVLHSAPLTPNYDGPRILDLGCGTGIWAIDMADTYSRAEVVGWDLSMIQPVRIPPNLTFRQRNFESPWHGEALESWDLIYMRMLAGSVSDWNDLYSKAWRHLKPGFGYLEQVELDLTPRCDDRTLPDNSVIQTWWSYLRKATDEAYKPLQIPDTRQRLSQLGFVDITEQVIKVPYNPWPTDPHLKEIGRWFNLGTNQGLQAISLGPLTRVFGWKKTDVDNIVADAKKEINNKKYHVYCNMHIWTARRPQQ